MNQQKQIEALETKLAEVSAELQRLKGGKAWQWLPQLGENYLLSSFEEIKLLTSWGNCSLEKAWFEVGRIFPETPEGRKAAELFAFCEGFRGRWKRSADKNTGSDGWLPLLHDGGLLEILKTHRVYGLPKWSTMLACRAFVDSEGGPEKFAEILKKGIF